MNKLLKTSLIYLIASLVAGVFYREFTVYMNFSGDTLLSVIHPHLLILGTFMFLIITLFNEQKNFLQDKFFKKFYIIYNSAVTFFSLTLLARGVVEVIGIGLDYSVDKMISGIAGLSHIFLTIALVMLFMVFNKALKKTN